MMLRTDPKAMLDLSNTELDCLSDIVADALDREGYLDEVMGWKTEFVEKLYERLINGLRETIEGKRNEA